MGRKVSLGAAISFAAVVSAVTVSLTYVYAMDVFNTRVADVNQRQAMYTKLSEIDQKTRQDYIGEITESALNDGICAGYIAGLSDPDARYLSAERYLAYTSGGQTQTIGAGIRTIQDADGNMEIIEVFPGSAAERAGLRKGDVITAIDGREVIRLTYGEALTQLDGTAGSAVRFNVLRAPEDGGDLQQFEFNIVRAEYSRPLIDSAVINGNVGYISVVAFQESMLEQFTQLLNSFREQNVCGLVIDLRSNSGGSVEAMAQALDELLPAGNMVMSIDKSGETTAQYLSDAGGLGLPISVIIDGSTYGAAEIFAADIQDYDRGLLIGGTTAGYGVQTEVVPLSDGSAVILPTARYIRVDGTEIHGAGISPDMEISLNEEQQAQFNRESLALSDDPQAQAAVTALMRQGADVAEPPGTVSSSAEEPSGDDASGAESSGGEAAGTEGSSGTEAAAESSSAS